MKIYNLKMYVTVRKQSKVFFYFFYINIYKNKFCHVFDTHFMPKMISFFLDDPNLPEIDRIISKFGIKIDAIGCNGAFGERALVERSSKYAKRNATIICNNETECIVIGRK